MTSVDPYTDVLSALLTHDPSDASLRRLMLIAADRPGATTPRAELLEDLTANTHLTMRSC